MKKVYLIILALLGVVSAWGAFTGTCEWKITSPGTYDGSTYNRSASDKNFVVIAETSGTVTIKNATFENTKTDNNNWGVIGVYQGNLVLENCTIHNYGTGIGAKCAAGTLTLKNCTIMVDNYRGYASAAVQVQSGASVTINGGSYTSVGTSVEVLGSGGTITIEDGNFKSTGTGTPAAGSPGNYVGAIFLDQQGSNKSTVNVKDGVFNGKLFVRYNSDNNTLKIDKGVFSTSSVDGQKYSSLSDCPAYLTDKSSRQIIAADGMQFVNYQAYTGSTIADVTPYDDFASAYAATTSGATINLLTGVTVSSNTTIEGRTITEKADVDALTVTGGTLTVQGTTTINANGSNNAVNVNGGNLTVPESTSVTMGKITQTSGTISLASGTYSQDVTDYLPSGNYEVEEQGGQYIVKKKTAPTSYERTGLTVGNFGTICLPYATTNIAGATFYTISYKDASNIYLDEVSGQLVAGKPYIYQATATSITCGYTGEVATAGNENGLYGSFAAINYNGTNIIDASSTTLTGKYVVYGNELRQCANGSALNANCAYVNLGEVPTSAPSAPGARRISMSIQGATGVENVQSTNAQVQKIMRNGQMFIVRDGVIYTMQGQITE